MIGSQLLFLSKALYMINCHLFKVLKGSGAFDFSQKRDRVQQAFHLVYSQRCLHQFALEWHTLKAKEEQIKAKSN